MSVSQPCGKQACLRLG